MEECYVCGRRCICVFVFGSQESGGGGNQIGTKICGKISEKICGKIDGKIDK